VHDSAALTEMVEGLTPHHRLHGVCVQVRVELLAGRWDAVRLLTGTVDRAVEANADTPCTGSVTALLYCAAASEMGGDAAEADRLEGKADAIGMQGFSAYLDGARLWLALARNDLPALRRLVDSDEPVVFLPDRFDRPAALLDALIALGDNARIEADAPAWLRPGTYVEPFALRALGIARKDEQLVDEAAARFAEMGLQWHAAETRKLLA
jgi:hypothetical protein